MNTATGRGRDTEQLLRRVGTHLDAYQQHITQRRWQFGRAQVAAGGDELLREERIALGAAEDGIDDLRRGNLAEDARELRDHIVAVETLEVDPLRSTAAFHLGEERPQRMAPVQLVAAERRHDDDACRAELMDEVRQQVAGRPISPVEVLDDEEQRAFESEPLEQSEHDLEEAGDGAGCLDCEVLIGRAEFGHEATELGRGRTGVVADRRRAVLADERAQHLDHRTEGWAGLTEIDARPAQHTDVLQPRSEFPDESRLAHACLAAHDDGA
jgi:hypothetical protein